MDFPWLHFLPSRLCQSAPREEQVRRDLLGVMIAGSLLLYAVPDSVGDHASPSYVFPIKSDVSFFLSISLGQSLI